VMARRERVMMLEAFGKGIMGTTLHYPYEIRGEDAVFEDIPQLKLPDQMVGLAEDIIDKMSGEFEPDKFEDRYENAMVELIRSKQAGMPAPQEKAPCPPRQRGQPDGCAPAQHRGQRGQGEGQGACEEGRTRCARQAEGQGLTEEPAPQCPGFGSRRPHCVPQTSIRTLLHRLVRRHYRKAEGTLRGLNGG
jgi:hypothetical protein